MIQLTRKISLISFLLGMAILIFMAAPVWASGDCKGHSCNEPGTDITVNPSSVLNNSVRDSSSSYGFGAGDVDINDCYRSYSVILYQDTKVNKLCLADQQIAQGLYEAGARTRCSIRSVVKDYDDFKHCVQLNTVVAYKPPPPPPPTVDKDEDEDDGRIQELEAQVAGLVNDYEQQMQAPPQVTRQTIHQPFLSDEKRAKLAAVLAEGK